MPKGDNAGRKPGSYKGTEERSKRVHVLVTPTVKAYIEAQGRGWLGDLLEDIATGKKKVTEN